MFRMGTVCCNSAAKSSLLGTYLGESDGRAVLVTENHFLRFAKCNVRIASEGVLKTKGPPRGLGLDRAGILSRELFLHPVDRRLLVIDQVLQPLDFLEEGLLLHRRRHLFRGGTLRFLRLLLQPAHALESTLQEVHGDEENEQERREGKENGKHDGPFLIPLQKPVFRTGTVASQ